MSSNILYIGTTNVFNLFHVGMTFDGRDPYDRWRKDAEYRKLPYLVDRVEFYNICGDTDHPYHEWIRNDGILDLRQLGRSRSPEVFEVPGETHEECIANLKKSIENCLEYRRTGIRPFSKFFVARPHQEWVNSVILDLWNGETCIIPVGACARFGKGLGFLSLFEKTKFRTMIVASYWLAANETFAKTVDQKWDITSDITVISPSYEEYVKAREKGGRVLIDVSLHVDSDKVDSQLLGALSKEDCLIVVDEADHGAWTPTSRSVLNQYIQSGNNLVSIATGTNLERALIGSKNILNPITVSYLDLLEAKRGEGFLFNNNYKGSGPNEKKLLAEIRKDPSKWSQRLSDIVEIATLSLDANSAWVEAMNGLESEERPNMTKLFARRNSHIQREVIRQLYDTSKDGTDVFTIYSNISPLPGKPAVMQFIPGTTKDVDNFVSLGETILPNIEWIALHGEEGHSNRSAEGYVNKLIETTDKEAVVIVSCSMGARSFSVANCIAVVNCVDNPSIATAVQRASRCLTPGNDKTIGLVIDYCFNPNKSSTFETDLVRSALEKKIDPNEDTETTVRRVYGLVNFMRMDKYGYPTQLKESDFVEFVTSPCNLRNMAVATVNLDKLLSVDGLASLLNDVKSLKGGSKELESLIESAKTYISDREKTQKPVDPKSSSIRDLIRKIETIIGTVGNVHALAPECSDFVNALGVVCSSYEKTEYYKELVGISPEIVKYLSNYLPLSILDLYLIKSRETNKVENFESEFGGDSFLFLPEQVL